MNDALVGCCNEPLGRYGRKAADGVEELGALRAENPELLTVILPQTVTKQPREIRELLGQVQKVVELGHDQLPLDAASRICNSELLSKGDQLIVFAFHDSKTLRETIERGGVAQCRPSEPTYRMPGTKPVAMVKRCGTAGSRLMKCTSSS